MICSSLNILNKSNYKASTTDGIKKYNTITNIKALTVESYISSTILRLGGYTRGSFIYSITYSLLNALNNQIIGPQRQAVLENGTWLRIK